MGDAPGPLPAQAESEQALAPATPAAALQGKHLLGSLLGIGAALGSPALRSAGSLSTMLAFTLAACGGGGDDAAPPAPGVPPAPGPNPGPTPAPA
ncbi:hypothetical protein CK626_14365, partial [Vandammella animalimorsus]